METVTDIIQSVREDVCDKLCKYPGQYTPEQWEAVFEEICNDCPMDRL